MQVSRLQDDEGAGRIATVGSVVGGIVCAIGWYVWMAILLLPSHSSDYVWNCKTNPENITSDQFVAPCEVNTGAYWAPGLLMSLGVVMLNMIRWTSLTDEGLGDDGNAAKAKVWVGVCFVIMFCSLGGGIWIMIQARRRPRHAMPAGAARRSGRVGGGASLALGTRGVGPAHVRAPCMWRTQDSTKAQDNEKLWTGPAVAVLVQNICLFVGGLIFRVARRKEDHAI